MAAIQPPLVYRSSVWSSIGNALGGAVSVGMGVMIAIAGLFVAFDFHPLDVGRILFVLIIFWFMAAFLIAAGLYFFSSAVPHTVRFDPARQRYEYSWGVGPFSRSVSGSYHEVDCIYVEQDTHYTKGGSYMSWSAGVMWSIQRKPVVLTDARDGNKASTIAREIAAATAVPYGGVYDDDTEKWVEGPYHRQTAPDGSSVSSEIATGAPPMAQQPALAQPTPPHIDLPPALGDDAGLNESGMWK